MRELTGHKVNPANDTLKIEVIDASGSGGANHFYLITGADYHRNPSLLNSVNPAELGMIVFQNGAINDHGVNGVTQEALIEICIDRLKSFQAGPFSCRENAVALTHLETAQMWLQKRTLDRMRRGVEGTHKV